ncbi:two-component system, NtrC family, C4-dicarboxylate transport sensor histidine kinase DctB [Jannaschia seohaensis]|uniref:C4-dicarboxylate transport sensor protein DctB n=2 Tax=Jannaschia seohaensis TaxID=475081 RepID=A0A2Y9A4K4_9RHOB|nr:two-component system C4-dicarboxylate transport sensor histidine kinase DctB [Jannaschia seohaensis]SSA38816.1 two-component system, NtrC family, C4-dicarboxylate transport sensor histidine kinase DctB [Jannaschia seohaensis]
MFWRRRSFPTPGRSGESVPLRLPMAARILIGVMTIVAVGVVFVANGYLTDRFVETTRQRAELRQSLYAGAILSELQRNSVVPLLLARDQTLISALNARDFSASSQRLISYVDEIGAASIRLLDMDGRTVAATDRTQLGSLHAEKPFFTEAIDTTDTVFTLAPNETGAYEANFSRLVRDGTMPLGVLQVQVDLAQFESRWRGTTAAVAVTDAGGTVILSTEPRWRGKSLEEALDQMPVPSALERALASTGAFGPGLEDGWFSSAAFMQMEARVPFRGWRLVSFTSYESVRERVNGVLALIIMGFALALALGFYLLNRRSTLRSLLFQRESVALRRLNDRLSREIAERKRVQEELKETEQSLAQSSKLAALGEMSAAVSHELNQPLAAMKTYLAGARLLLQRRRPEEALSSFQRIDDLIDRMGAITRQLKSYARKGGEAFERIDVREALAAALTLMEPQMRQSRVRLTQAVPDHPVEVMADRLRLEQVIINLVRNALDAMEGMEDPELDLLLTAGEEVVIAVRDTGPGLAEPEKLFEPFYTTKKPGEGVGLGLAISSGIVSDHGGRLTARNGQTGGAVFEVRLPALETRLDAAE